MKAMRKLVYLSGPLTNGDRKANVRLAMDWTKDLADAGYAVFCPHLSNYFPWAWDEEYDHGFWVEFDLPMLDRCDFFVRIKSTTPSDGADTEEAYAKNHNIPCWDSVGGFLAGVEPTNLVSTDDSRSTQREETNHSAEEAGTRRLPRTRRSEANDNLSHFYTGAVRSSDANEFRFDLLSPIAARVMLNAASFRHLGTPARKHVGSAIEHIYVMLGGGGPANNVLSNALVQVGMAIDTNALAAAMEGAARASKEGEKYGDYNWEKGMPASDLLNHAIRHLLLFLRDDTTEDHLGHAAWNLMGAIHSLKMWPELNQGKFRTKGCKPPAAVAGGEDKP